MRGKAGNAAVSLCGQRAADVACLQASPRHFAAQPGVQKSGVEAIAGACSVHRRHFSRTGMQHRSLVQYRRTLGAQFQGHARRTGVGKSLEHAGWFRLARHACSFVFIGEEDVDLLQYAKRARVGQPIFVPACVQ